MLDERKALLPIWSMPSIDGLIIEVPKMVEAIYLAGHVAVTVIAVFGVCIKLEHRLTKIETDLTWLKQNSNCGEGCEDEK